MTERVKKEHKCIRTTITAGSSHHLYGRRILRDVGTIKI